MAFTLPPLPYPENALEPHVSAQTLQFHHGKHHKKYVDTLNKLIEGTEMKNQSLEEIILSAADDLWKQKIFNNAGQVWNHNFFWQCMTPQGGGHPDGELLDRIQEDFGSFDKFRKEFIMAAEAQFGSGWAWLTEDNGKLNIMTTSNADLPLTRGETALLTCDVWEHAYYLDYQNDRAKFVEVFLSKLANWQFAQQQLNAGGHAMQTGKDDKLGSRHDEVEGEGSYKATRDYQKGVEKTVASGQVEQRAQEAKQALDGAEGDELRQAEETGRNAAGGSQSGKIRDSQLKRAKDAPQGAEAGYARGTGGSDAGVEGEGSYTASRAYQKGIEKTVKSGKVEEKAQEAKRALEGPEGDKLREAERRGQMAAKMEDPSLHTRGKGKQQG